jgi:hypothetical protein
VSVLPRGSISAELFAEFVIGVIGVRGFISPLSPRRDPDIGRKLLLMGDRGGVLAGDAKGDGFGELRGDAVRLDLFC